MVVILLDESDLLAGHGGTVGRHTTKDLTTTFVVLPILYIFVVVE